VCGIRKSALLGNRRKSQLSGLKQTNRTLYSQAANIGPRCHPDLSTKDFRKAVRRQKDGACDLLDAQWARKAILHVANRSSDRCGMSGLVDGSIRWSGFRTGTREENEQS
jgi:hypothetical protein